MDSLDKPQCSDDYLLSLTSPSHESKTLRVLGGPIENSKESEGQRSYETDSLAGGFPSIGPSYPARDSSYNPRLTGGKTHESGLYETVRNQAGGLKACQISDIGSDPVLHNYRSVIRLNERCSQHQQVQAVPVIRAPPIGTFNL